MSTRNRLRMGVGTLYALAIVVSLFAGGLVWVAIIGAVLSGLAYSRLGGWSGGGRNRNRNRNRDRNRDRG